MRSAVASDSYRELKIKNEIIPLQKDDKRKNIPIYSNQYLNEIDLGSKDSLKDIEDSLGSVSIKKKKWFWIWMKKWH